MTKILFCWLALPSGCLAACTLLNGILLNPLRSGESCVNHFIHDEDVLIYDSTTKLVCDNWSLSSMIQLQNSLKKCFLEILLMVGEFHFNVTKYWLEIFISANPFLRKLNCSLKLKLTKWDYFWWNNIFDFQIFFNPLLLHFFLCFFFFFLSVCMWVYAFSI